VHTLKHDQNQLVGPQQACYIASTCCGKPQPKQALVIHTQSHAKCPSVAYANKSRSSSSSPPSPSLSSDSKLQIPVSSCTSCAASAACSSSSKESTSSKMLNLPVLTVLQFFHMYQVPCGTLGAIWHPKPCLAFEDSSDLQTPQHKLPLHPTKPWRRRNLLIQLSW
jgi:hypothetical protein